MAIQVADPASVYSSITSTCCFFLVRHVISLEHAQSTCTSRLAEEICTPDLLLSQVLLANHIACSSIRYCHHNLISLCIVVKRYILQQKCLKKLTGSVPLEHDFTTFSPLHRLSAIKLHCS